MHLGSTRGLSRVGAGASVKAIQPL